mgnify:CR=1 FL=1
MKSMKGFIAGMLCVTLIAGILSGCGGPEAEVGSPEVENGRTENESGSGTELQSGTGEDGTESPEANPESAGDGKEGTGDEKDAASGEEEAIQIPEVEIKPFDIPEGEALQFVRDMKIGWNLGNTFDAINDSFTGDELELESSWCGIKTTAEMMQDIKEAGFNSVRIPVSWHNHVDENWQISEAWLNRVQEVVDYASDNGLYIILNIHHDNSEDFLYPDSAHLEQTVGYVTTIWEPLCQRCQEYEAQLIFECMNEPRLVGSQYEWWLNPGAEECQDAVSCINEINQAFVNTVRESGGNNGSRYLMVPGYCASPDGVLNSGFVLPEDAEGVENRLILSVHAYTPYNFALQAEGESGSTSKFDSDSAGSVRDINSFMDQLYNKYISNGIPVVIGEFGSRDKSGNLQDRVDHAAYYIAAAKARGITCVWWDNNAFSGDGENFGIYYRRQGKFLYPDILNALMKYAD